MILVDTSIWIDHFRAGHLTTACLVGLGRSPVGPTRGGWNRGDMAPAYAGARILLPARYLTCPSRPSCAAQRWQGTHKFHPVDTLLGAGVCALPRQRLGPDVTNVSCYAISRSHTVKGRRLRSVSASISRRRTKRPSQPSSP